MVIVLVTATISGAGLVFAMQEPTRYTASVEIILRNNPYRFFRSGEYPSFFPDHFSRSTRAQLIRSREVLTYAVRNNLAELYPSAGKDAAALDEAIRNLRGNLGILQNKDSEIITITYQENDQEKAIQTVNGVAQAFEEVSKIRQERGIEEAITFIRSTREARSEEASAVRQDLTRVKRQKSEMTRNLDEEKYRSVIEELGSLRESAREMRLERNRLSIEVNTINSLLEGEKDIPVSNADLSQKNRIEAEIGKKEVELVQLRRRYTDGWPQINQVRSDIAFLKERIELVRNNEQSSARQDLLDRSREMDLRRKQIGSQLAHNVRAQETKALEKQGFDASIMAELIRVENQEQELEARVKALDESAQSLEDYAQRLQINKRMIVEAVYPLDPAKTAPPMTKRGVRTFPLILMTALIVGIAFAYLLEYLNTSIRTEHDIKRYVNLPLFGMVLKIREESDRLLLHAPPKSPISELFNTISAMVEAQARENGSKTFMVASPNAGEGKSTITTNIAIALARGGARVILIDADLRRAVLHKFFNVNNQEGLATFMADPDHANADISHLLHGTEVENLRVIPAGPHPANPVLLLKSKAFRSLLERLDDQADFILVDVPPVRIAVDTILLAPQVQNTILLTSAGETNKEDVAFAKNLIESAKGNLVGCILNKADSHGEGYYYYYDYNRYYGRR